RVVITPGEVSPSEFSHPLLIARKPDPAPVPVAAVEPKDVPTVKAETPAITVTPAMSSASLDLKPSVSDTGRTAADSRRDQTQTADASGAMTPSKPATMSDAAPAKTDGARVTRRDVDEAAAKALEPVVEARPAAPAADTAKAAAAPAAASEVKPDDARPVDSTATVSPASAPEPTPAVTAAPKRTGQIAVLVSRKDGKLYVRQNFAPLFDVPVTIAAGDRPLGTHIFTARADKDDARAFRWTAVSLPSVPHRAERGDEDSPAARRRKATGAVEMKSTPLPSSAAEALDRITIPPEAMAQIADALASGSSIIVSDHGINAGGETGQGTEFVVPLR
ncbi:MAG: L,D-transpeptidase, partial [Tardiphaga sp.]